MGQRVTSRQIGCLRLSVRVGGPHCRGGDEGVGREWWPPARGRVAWIVPPVGTNDNRTVDSPRPGLGTCAGPAGRLSNRRFPARPTSASGHRPVLQLKERGPSPPPTLRLPSSKLTVSIGEFGPGYTSAASPAGPPPIRGSGPASSGALAVDRLCPRVAARLTGMAARTARVAALTPSSAAAPRTLSYPYERRRPGIAARTPLLLPGSTWTWTGKKPFP